MVTPYLSGNNTFKVYYTNVGIRLSPSKKNPYDEPFSILELQSVISKLPGKRAPGKDGITYDVIKWADETLQSRLLTLFNNIFVTAHMPDEWRVSLLMPLYKGKGPLMSPDSYRGIALIPVLQKIYTALIYDGSTDWEEQKTSIPDCQYGFRRKRSTLDATRKLRSHIQSGMSTVSRYYCVYVNFWNAFDSIDRRKLTKKLYDFFVQTRILDAIISILSDTRFQICQGNYLSDEILTDSGVPQGDKLSPLLFSRYIADLAPVLTITGCDVVFYADDAVIGSTVIDKVQNALDVLSVYGTGNDLEVNVDKTKNMKFRNRGSLGRCERLTYNNTPLEYVSNFTYLGIVLSTTFTIMGHLSHLKKKPMKAINSVRNSVNLQKTGFQAAYRLLESVIKPVASYGVTVFDGPDDAIMTQDHCRRVIGLYWKLWARISSSGQIRTLYITSMMMIFSVYSQQMSRIDVLLLFSTSTVCIIFCVLEVIAMAHPTLWTVPAGSARSHLSRNFTFCHVLPSPTFQ